MEAVDEQCPPPVGRLAYVSVGVAVAVLSGLTLSSSAGDGTSGVKLALDITLTAVSVAIAPLMVRWPVPVTVALGALVAVSPVVTPAATIGLLTTARTRPLRTAIAVAAVGLAGHAVQGVWRLAGGIAYGWWLLLIVIAYAAIVAWGALWRVQAERVQALRDRARRAEAEQETRVREARRAERTRLAREMHDVLAHRLSLVATYAGALEYRPDSTPEQIATAAGVVRAGVHQALDELRQVITVMRDDDDDSFEEPGPSLTDVTALVTESRDAGVDVSFTLDLANAGSAPGASGRTAYRIVQEALTNARKHAPGQPVAVRLDGRPGERLNINVTNAMNGASGTRPGVGLIGLAERVALVGGQIEHGITAEGDFQLRAWLPWPA